MVNPDFKIRSFVKRKGRITNSQHRALKKLLPEYSVLPIDCASKKITSVDFNTVFAKQSPIHLEVGFGNGESLLTMARTNPNINYLGVEVYDPGVGHLLRRVKDMRLSNVKLAHVDAMEFIKYGLTDNSLDKFMLFFPNPWHKKRYNKRRIIRDEFVLQIVRTLRPGGHFHMATDWQDYAEQTVSKINRIKKLENISLTNDYVPRPNSRPKTKFELRGLRLGHKVWDMIWRKCE